MSMKMENRTGKRLTQFFLLFVGAALLVALAVTRVQVTKVHADVKAVETFECDPDTDTVVFFAGPVSLSGSSCTGAMKTLTSPPYTFQFQTARGPEAIDRQHLTAGTDSGPGHSYYLMIFWED
jgi:hypothetical protein